MIKGIRRSLEHIVLTNCNVGVGELSELSELLVFGCGGVLGVRAFPVPVTSGTRAE
jgi:hypothetical protein